MASSRAIVAFDEAEALVLTFKYDSSIVADTNRYDLGQGSTEVGTMVELVSDSTVGLGTTAHFPMGKLIKVDNDGFCSVTVSGVVSVPYVSGNANNPIVGRGVQIDGAGNVISPAGGARLATERGIVLSLDSVNQVCYVKLW